jgi:hypothetical protein
MSGEVVRFPVGINREIARLREITAESANNQLLGEGPPHPEAALLDLCAVALHLLTHAERALAACQRMLFASVASGVQPQAAHYSERDRLHEEYRRGIAKAKPLLRRIAKLRATTAAGIYAKALVVRASRTGAPVLAMSLAADMIDCPGLRASLWPADVSEVQP